MVGESCAVAAAFTWSVAVVLFKRSEEASPQAINLFKNVGGTALLGLTFLAQALVRGEAPSVDFSAAEWGLLAVSGVLGIAVADTLIFMALRRLGAGLLAVVDCVYAPALVLLSVLFLGEALSAGLAVGAAVLAIGVLLATTERRVAALDERPRERLVGIGMGLAGILIMGLGVIVAKPILERNDLVLVTFIRLAAGMLAQLAWIALVPAQREALSVFGAPRVWRTLAPATFLGTYVAMLFWLGGFKWASASVASVLNQLSTVFTLLLAWMFLGEVLTLRRGVGAALAVGGAFAVVISR